MTPTTADTRHWGWVLADGVLGVVVGVAALVWPGITVLALAVLLGIGLLVQGSVEVAAGITVYRGTPGRVWTIVLGALAIAAGVICLVSPSTGLVAIVIGAAVWFFGAGVNELVAASLLREGRVWNIVTGVLSLVAGVVVVAQPGVGLATAAVLTGVLFVVRGAGEIALAVQVRRITNN